MSDGSQAPKLLKNEIFYDEMTQSTNKQPSEVVFRAPQTGAAAYLQLSPLTGWFLLMLAIPT